MKKKVFGATLLLSFLGIVLLVKKFVRTSPYPKSSTYSQSKNCIDCHKQQYDDWKNSHHALAEGEITGIKYLAPNQVERVIGVFPLRQYLIKFPGGKYQVHEMSFDPQKKEWFNVFGKENRKVGEWGHWTGKGMNWNSNCASCHNTGVLKNYDERTDSYSTKISEMGVSCESCHGPMNEHTLWQKSNKGFDPTLKKLSKDQIFETCASCHSRRQDLTGKFMPGDSFHDHFNLAIVDSSDIFYVDGQVKGENYEYSSFLGSKMHERGVRCIDCHNPHTGKTRAPGNLLCLQCHGGSDPSIPKIDPASHSFHKIDPLYFKEDLKKLAERENVSKMGGECINCHMPQTIYMQRHRRHDHGFTIPDPLLTKEFKIPNACNRCHLDKSVDWAIKWTNKWYGKKMERDSRERTITFSKVKNGDKHSIENLLEYTKNTNSSYWKAAGVNILSSYLQEEKVQDLFRDFLTNPFPLVREKVSQYLPDEKLLSDPFRSIRFNAQWGNPLKLNLVSKSELEEIINFKMDQVAGRMQKGTYLNSLGKPLEAILEYKIAAQWDGQSPILLHDLAIMLAGINQVAESANYLEKAIKLDSKDADLRFKLGLAYAELGKKEKAIKSFREALRLDPNHQGALNNLKIILR